MLIVGASLIGATSVKPVKLKHQLYADLQINGEIFSCVLIIIPKLNENCILGYGLLKKFKSKIDIGENYIVLRDNVKQIKIEFLKEEEKHIRLIHEVNMKSDNKLINIDQQNFANENNVPGVLANWLNGSFTLYRKAIVK